MSQVSVLRRHGFGYLALSALLSRFGDVLAGLGFLYTAYRLTGSQSATTAVAVAEVVPYLVFGLIGGVLSDSLPKLRVMMAANWYRAALEVVVAGLVLTNTMTFAALLVFPLLIQLGGVVYNPCSRASVIHVVDAEDRVAGNSVMSLIENVTVVTAPLLASGILLFGDALWLFFLLDAVTFVAGSLLLRALGRTPRGASLLVTEQVPVGAAGVLSRTAAKMKLFWSGVAASPVLVQVFVSTFLAVLCGTWAWQIGTFFITVPDPRSSTLFYSFMLALFAVAGIITSVVLPLVTQSLTVRVYQSAVAVWAVGLLIIGLTGGRVGVAVGVLVLGTGVSLASQSRAYLLQHHVPPWAIGQGFAASAVLLYGADALSLGIFGVLVGVLRPETAVVLAGSAMLLSIPISIAVFGLFAMRRRPAVPGPLEDA